MATDQSESLLADQTQREILVKCGPIEGSLYLDRLLGGQTGKEGSIKCIYCSTKSKWVSPVEFESLGGKSKSGKWRQSIKTSNNLSIATYLSSLGIDISRSQSPARSVSPSLFSLPSSVTNPVFIISPLLAFVKAFRLRGDTSTLRQAVTAHFDTPSLTDAHKHLWDFCGDLLKELGVTYHTRRSTDKRDAFEATLTDILSAFNKLDEVDKLPPIYCEATHLISLPCLEPDPISKRLDSNHKAITCLDKKVDNFPVLLDDTQIKLDELVSSLKDQLSDFTSSMTSFSKLIANKASGILSQPPSKLSTTTSTSNTSPHSTSVDRSANVILFGVPELSLPATKSVIDEVALHLIGRPVSIKDAFRIGRRKQNLDESSRPRPLLIKLNNFWDRRLLLAARFTLKSFEKYKLYLREDLPPQARQSFNRKSSNSSQHDFHEKVALSDPVNVPTDRDSTCDVMDGSTK